MAEGAEPSQYVKLETDQGPFEEIRPGELNQPVHVPQLFARKCRECGQPLPENFVRLTDESWTSGIFGCAEDPDSCWTGLFCPCILFGRNVERLRDDGSPWTTPCICHAIVVEGGIALAAAATALAFHGIDLTTLIFMGQGVYLSWLVCGMYTGFYRDSLQKKYHLKNSPCIPYAVHCCMHWCALCQEHREMKGRLSDKAVIPVTMVNPPLTQEMTNDNDNNGTAPTSERWVEHTNLEMHIL